MLSMPITCFVQLFGCDFTSLWQTANQKRCHALLRAGRLVEVFEACRYMADMSDESTKASCLDWTIGKSLGMSPRLRPSQYFSQVSCKRLARSELVLPREMLPATSWYASTKTTTPTTALVTATATSTVSTTWIVDMQCRVGIQEDYLIVRIKGAASVHRMIDIRAT
jgi:hypothetical protein